jgi:hypothetical protein
LAHEMIGTERELVARDRTKRAHHAAGD